MIWSHYIEVYRKLHSLNMRSIESLLFFTRPLIKVEPPTGVPRQTPQGGGVFFRQFELRLAKKKNPTPNFAFFSIFISGKNEKKFSRCKWQERESSSY